MANILIDKIVSTNPAITTNDLNKKKPDVSQDLLHTILDKIVLRQLAGKSKDYCKSSHIIEDNFSKGLMYSSLTREFLFGVIEEICEVSLVQRGN